jgi:HlyD family secretion protein
MKQHACKFVFVALIELMAVVATSGCQRGTTAPTANAAEGPKAGTIRVTVSKLARKTLVAKTTQPARIEAFEQTPLFAKIAGYVKEVHVDIGDKVTKGQPLITLDEPELANDVDQKAALVRQAEAGLKQADAEVVAAQAAVATAAAKIDEAKAVITQTAAEHERWRGEYDRVKELAGSGTVTQKLAEETLNQLRAAEASRAAAGAGVQSAEAAERQAQANTVKAEADRVASDARLGVANADLARAKTILDYATIRSPYDGVVTTREIHTGHFVQPGASGTTPVMTVARTDKVRVYVEVPELEAGGVDVGDPVVIHMQASTGADITGQITRTSWSLDPSNRSLRAEIDLPNDKSQLRPGMYATAAIELAKREGALAIPTAAVLRDDKGTYCYTVEDGKIVRRGLQLGVRSSPDVEVLGGITEQDQIVTVHPETLAPGQDVQVAEAAK